MFGARPKDLALKFNPMGRRGLRDDIRRILDRRKISPEELKEELTIILQATNEPQEAEPKGLRWYLEKRIDEFSVNLTAELLAAFQQRITEEFTRILGVVEKYRLAPDGLEQIKKEI